jgi:hypothetical protein
MVRLSAATSLVVVDGGPVYLIRGREPTFILSDGEWKRLAAILAAAAATADDEGAA